MQQVIGFDSSAKEQQPIDVRATIQRKIKSLNLWLDQKRNEKIKANICNSQNFLLSLPCQKLFRGTDAAESPRQFLYPHVSKINTAAPCRVYGNAPGGLAKGTLTTRSAAFLCQNPFNMATTINASRATWRTLTIREWMSRKNECFSTLCGEEFTNQHVLLAHLFCIALIALCCVAEWLEGGAL